MSVRDFMLGILSELNAQVHTWLVGPSGVTFPLIRPKTQELWTQGYAYLAQEERYHIEVMRGEGFSIQRTTAGMN